MSKATPKFATKETIMQPVGGLIVEAPEEQDHVLGSTGELFSIVCDDGHWAPFAPDHELQRNRFGDTYMCVSFSKNNILEFLAKKMFGETLDLSDIFLGSGSGTKRGRGNSKRAVAEWQRLNGAVLESDYPYTEETTLDQAYAPLSDELLAKGKEWLKSYTPYYKWVSDNSPASLMAALRFSPVQVDVSGSYVVNASGYVVWNKANPTYNHEVAVFDYEEGKCWWVFDSETQQYLKFAWNYPFGSPMIHALKKTMNTKIYKVTGQAALGVKHHSEDSMIVFSGGSVDGGELFLSLYGLESFADMPITEVSEWPYPVRHAINTTPLR